MIWYLLKHTSFAMAGSIHKFLQPAWSWGHSVGDPSLSWISLEGFIMNQKATWTFCVVLLASIVAVLVIGADCQAARTSEVETNYYYCEEDDESLGECEWLGMRFFPCEGTSWTEGDTDNPNINYKVVSVESCGGGSGGSSCFVKAFSGEAIPISCSRWPWFPWPLPDPE